MPRFDDCIKKESTPARMARRGGVGEIKGGLFQGEAGDGTAGDVFVGDGRHVGVCDILEAVDAGGQDEPF